jgi:hypothetical protein
MLSTGSRRKIALVGLLASGATVTCLDQPFAALDERSSRVIREFLSDMADHTRRSWVVADYEADPRLPWPLPGPGDQGVDRFRRALEDALHPSVGEVADPSVYAVFGGHPAAGVAVVDALHETGD